MYIYCITNLINGKQYVGKCHRTPEISKNYYGSGNLIKKSILKYGKNNFKKEILERDLTIEDICNKEIYWIKEYNSKHPNGYNLCDGGGGVINPSDEIRKKMSDSHIGKFCGENSPNYGRKMSDEQKLKISISKKGQIPPNKGVKMSEESKLKMKTTKLNNPLTDEVRLKMSESHKGKHSWNKGISPSDETRKKIGDGNRGKKMSESAKLKIGLAGKGRCVSIETRKKISEKNIGKKMSESAKLKIGLSKKNLSEESRKKISDAAKNKPKMSESDKLKFIESVSRVSVSQIDKNTNEVINTFKSIKEAWEITNCNRSKISMCINGQRETTGGYKWKKVE